MVELNPCKHEWVKESENYGGYGERCQHCNKTRWTFLANAFTLFNAAMQVPDDEITMARMRALVLQNAAAKLDDIFMNSPTPAEPEPQLSAHVEAFLKTL